MRLWGDSFSNGAAIPAEFAFGKPDPKTHVTWSSNRNPHLAWDGLPDGTQSLVLIVRDVDVPSLPDDVNREGRTIPAELPRTGFDHWVLFDLPADLASIAAGAFSDGVVAGGKAGPMIVHDPVPGALHGLNDYTSWFAADQRMAGDYYGYDGPCPPWNDCIVHRYVFTLSALSVDRLVVTGRVTGDAVREAMNGVVLGTAEMTGLYSLNPAVAPAAR